MMHRQKSSVLLCERCLALQNEQREDLNVFSGVNVISKRTINELPEELLQYIFSLLPPYQDLKNCKLVCRRWRLLIDDLIKCRKGKLLKSLLKNAVHWEEFVQEPKAMVAGRYSPATCYFKDFIYVFGGSTNNNTTFNDLWKFDLGSRRWIRPLVTGTYPPPKAFATFVSYENHLILFGGLNNPPFYNFDQSVRLNSQVHLYNVINDNWTELDISNPPDHVAGHSATVHNHKMVVFGGHRFLNNSNEVWVLDLKNVAWWKPETTNPKPEPRFGQTQVFVDRNNLLIIGGCGGPNKILSDVWLLTIGQNKVDTWTWKKMIINNPGLAAPHVWSHAGCKVDSHVVFLGKYSEARPVPMPPMGRFMNLGRLEGTEVHYGIHTERFQNNSNEIGHNNKVKNDSVESLRRNCARCDCELKEVDTRPNTSGSQRFKLENMTTKLSKPGKVLRNTAMPSIKPNSMKNRQRQLEGCQRMEQRIRHLARSSTSQPSGDPAGSKDFYKSLHSPVAVYVLDISRAVHNGEVEWTIIHVEKSSNSPLDALFYSIDYSEAEIIVFGGIRNDTLFEPFSLNNNPLSNSVHILSYTQNSR